METDVIQVQELITTVLSCTSKSSIADIYIYLFIYFATANSRNKMVFATTRLRFKIPLKETRWSMKVERGQGFTTKRSSRNDKHAK